MPVIVFLSRLPGPGSHSVYIVTLYLALHHSGREAGGHLRVTGEVFVSIKETKTETSFALKRNSKIQFFPILFFCFDPEFFHLYAK